MSDFNVEELVDAFVASWQAGIKPSLQQCLEQAPESSREQLLAKLIPIDVEYRLKALVITPILWLFFSSLQFRQRVPF